MGAEAGLSMLEWPAANNTAVFPYAYIKRQLLIAVCILAQADTLTCAA